MKQLPPLATERKQALSSRCDEMIFHNAVFTDFYLRIELQIFAQRN